MAPHTGCPPLTETPWILDGAIVRRTDSTELPVAYGESGAARLSSNSVDGTAFARISAECPPSVTRNAPVQPPDGHVHCTPTTRATPGVSGSSPLAQRGVEQSAPVQSSSHTQPITRVASHPAYVDAANGSADEPVDPSAAAAESETQRPRLLHAAFPAPGHASVWHAAPEKPCWHVHTPRTGSHAPTPAHSASTA